MAVSKSLLGSFYPTCETFQTEFKEFWVKYSPTLTMDKEAIKKVIYSGRICSEFQESITKNIEIYIKNYVPKYISCFANSNTNGKLIIGIKDDGEYTGIPSITPITLESIEQKVYNLYPKYIKSSISIEKFKSLIDISVDTLEIPTITEFDDPIDNIIRMCKQYKLNKACDTKQFIEDKLKWHSKMNRYRGLLMILNQDDTRNELIQYIKMREQKQSLISIKKQTELARPLYKISLNLKYFTERPINTAMAKAT